MGIILWQSFFDRLRGKRFGNTSFVRFPLRLLTFQQLQRLARAMAAAEMVRKSHGLKGAKFSIGYLVGGTVTPNSISPEQHDRFSRHGVDPKFQRIFKCPFCEGDVSVSYEPSLRLIEHHCKNNICAASKERLPIYITDQDIYRFVPTVIVSTVDKLALLGQNHRFSNIFGRIHIICSKHGANFNKSIPQHLNWVEKRAACTIAKVFNELCDGIVEDVKLANLAHGFHLDQEFHATMHSEGTTIFIGQPNLVPRKRVIVGITGDKIEVRIEATSDKWDVTIGLNDQGRCVFRLSDNTELEQWQFRKKALEALLFGEGRSL